MNRAFAATAAFVGASMLVSGCGSSRHTVSLPGLTAAKLAKLTASVRKDATLNGDPHPSSATVYASRHHEAVLAMGEGGAVREEQPVYVVVIRGHFVCTGCSRPTSQSPPPRGNVITDVVDRETLNELDWAIGVRVNTRKFGPGVPVAVDRG